MQSFQNFCQFTEQIKKIIKINTTYKSIDTVRNKCIHIFNDFVSKNYFPASINEIISCFMPAVHAFQGCNKGN